MGKQEAAVDVSAGDSGEAAESAAVVVAGKAEPAIGMGLEGRWKMGQSEWT